MPAMKETGTVRLPLIWDSEGDNLG
jgi:hypothetical protein